MRNTSKLPSAEPKNLRARAANSLSYQNIAGGLASEMVDYFLRCNEPRKSSPPFRLVIVGNHGGVVFECEVWRGAQPGTFRAAPAFPFSCDGLAHGRFVTDSHFPHRAGAAG